MEITRSKLEELAGIEPYDTIQFSGSIKVKDEEVIITHPNRLKIHKLANELPKMSEEEYQTLKKSIEENGQLIPVYIYRGKLVDGRHRLKALKELNSNIIKYISLPNNWTLAQVKEFILGTEQRRHETKAQLAIRAYFDYKQHGGSMQDYALKYSVDKSDISRAKRIEEELGTKYLNELLSNRKINVNGRYYSNLKSIVSYINKQKKEIQKIEKEPITDIQKNAKKIIEKATISGSLDDLHYIISEAKKAYEELLSK